MRKAEDIINDLSAKVGQLKQLVTTYPSQIWDDMFIHINGSHMDVSIISDETRKNACRDFAAAHREGGWKRDYVPYGGGSYSWNGELQGIPVSLYAVEPTLLARCSDVFPEDEQAAKQMAQNASEASKEDL